MTRGHSVLHQGKTAKAIARSLRAAKAAEANGMAVDRVEYVMPDGSKLTIFPKQRSDQSDSGNELTPDEELKRWRREKKQHAS